MLYPVPLLLYLSGCLHFSVSGFLSEEHPEEHGVHVSQRQSLCHKQGDEEPVSVLSTAEMPRCWHVQGVWVQFIKITSILKLGEEYEKYFTLNFGLHFLCSINQNIRVFIFNLDICLPLVAYISYYIPSTTCITMPSAFHRLFFSERQLCFHLFAELQIERVKLMHHRPKYSPWYVSSSNNTSFSLYFPWCNLFSLDPHCLVKCQCVSVVSL